MAKDHSISRADRTVHNNGTDRHSVSHTLIRKMRRRRTEQILIMVFMIAMLVLFCIIFKVSFKFS